jgi:flagellar basal-body rod modification protein FlgD
MSAIPSTGTGTSASGDTTPNTSLTSLNSTDFMQFLITQLQNQDPLQPTDSNQMLSQLSSIGQMQSATDLQTSLTSMVQQNQVAAASSMIGKSVQGTDANNNPLTGIVTAVQVNSNGVSLQLDSGATLALNNVTSITNAPGTTTAATTGS